MALVLTVVLLLANAFFVGAEFALVSARRSRMEELAAGGSRRARRAIAGMQDISVILAGAQLGIAVASLGLGALSEPALERGFSTLLHITGLPQGVSHILAFAGALLIVAGAHVEIEPGESGLSHTSYAKAEDIKSVSTQRLVRRLGAVSADRLERAEHALRLLLDL